MTITILASLFLLVGPGPTRLPIPDRGNASGAPPEGWCAESAIQQTLLYFGAWVPQAVINMAGSPEHPDLYAQDIEPALKVLGLRFTRHASRTMPALLSWIRGRIDAGLPVLLGVKVNPSKHPEWGLDHFVLVAGYERDALIINTTWGRQSRRTDAQLSSTERGLSIENGRAGWFALSIDGLTGGGSTSVRVVREVPLVMLEVTCTHLTAGRTYRLLASSSFGGPATALETFVASGTTAAFSRQASRRRAAFFRCAP